MEIFNIILGLLIMMVSYLILKFFYMRNYYSKVLVKSPIKLKKTAIIKPCKKLGNIFFNIKVGNNPTIHRIVLKLYDNIVPMTCQNFRILVSKGINGRSYKNAIFHRIIKGFMIQGGDIINSNGTGSMSIYGKEFEDENFKLKHNKSGVLSMANSGPNTNGSQFFITTSPAKYLDNKHVVFGEVISGMKSIKLIETTKTDPNDKPYNEIKITDCGEINSN